MITVRGRGIHKPQVQLQWIPELGQYHLRIDDEKISETWMEIYIPLSELQALRHETTQAKPSNPGASGIEANLPQQEMPEAPSGTI